MIARHQKIVDLDTKLDNTLLDPNCLLLPTKPNQKVVDFIVGTKALFQVTLSSSHSFKNAHLKDLLTKWGTKKEEAYFFYVVPNDVFKTFVYQNVEGISAEGQKKSIKQYVVSIDCVDALRDLVDALEDVDENSKPEGNQSAQEGNMEVTA